MSEAKHTPGPWRLVIADNLIEAQSGGRLVDLCIPRSLCVTESEREANARLIAAAPEMLAELKLVRGYFDAIRLQTAAIGEYTAVNAKIERLDTLIAKATGRD